MQRPAILVLSALFALASAGALASDGTTVRLEIYNGGTITASQCRVYGKPKTSKRSSLLRTIDHTGNNRTESYTITVPDEYRLVQYSCRPVTSSTRGTVSTSYGKVEQDLDTQPADRQGGKASCSSPDPCVMSIVGI